MGDLPLPILLKIKKGILYIPSSYRVSEGLAVAMKGAMCNLQHIGRPALHRAIFDRNSMNDEVFSSVLRGLRSRPEFMGIHSVSNEIKEMASKQICNILNKETEDLGYDAPPPELQELTLISNKCKPESMDEIIAAIKNCVSLKKLTLRDMAVS